MGLLALRASNPLIVTNTNDSGSGSLRAAIQFAKSQPSSSTITFAIPGAGPHTITLSSALPDLTANGLTIDGSTQSGTQCRDLWVGSGHDLRINMRGSSGFDGFRLLGANQTVRGLSITGFAQAIGIAGNGATIRCNYLGLLADGTASANSRGVWVTGNSALVGGLNAGEGNVISGNSGIGIRLDTDDSITPSTDTIRIQRNRIGFNRTLSALLPNGGNGIFFDSGRISNVLISGNAVSEGNAISSGNDAIDLRAVSNIRIRGNTIARAPARGIWMAGSTNITIGGTAVGEGNSIGGNGTQGISVSTSTGVTILGNLIQPLTIAGSTSGNGGNGIRLQDSSNIDIGDGTPGGGEMSRTETGGGRSFHLVRFPTSPLRSTSSAPIPAAMLRCRTRPPKPLEMLTRLHSAGSTSTI